MENKKKKFLLPLLEIVNYSNADIITVSEVGEGDWGDGNEEEYDG